MVPEGARKSTMPLASRGVVETPPTAEWENVMSKALVRFKVSVTALITAASAAGEGGEVAGGVVGDVPVAWVALQPASPTVAKVAKATTTDRVRDLTGTGPHRASVADRGTNPSGDPAWSIIASAGWGLELIEIANAAGEQREAEPHDPGRNCRREKWQGSPTTRFWQDWFDG
jgi:hypothetical protein